MNFVKTGVLLAMMTALFMGVGYLLGGPTGVAIAFVVALVTNGFAFWSSDKLALRMHNAEPVTRASAPDLFQMVDDLSRNADMPTPAIYVIRTDQPNAFATGRDPHNAAVAVTTGLMNMLSREELAGVVAHELAHIKNRDTLIMTIAATIAGAISMLANFGLMFGAGRGERNPLGLIGMLVAVFVAPMAAMMVQMMISRTREYAADRLGAEICGNPMWLAGALAKISGQSSRFAMESAERNPASAHLFIVNPLDGRRMDNLFSTHPNTQNRIDALYEMAAHGGHDGDSPVRRRRSATGRFASGAAQALDGEASGRSGPRAGPWGRLGSRLGRSDPQMDAVRSRRGGRSGPWGGDDDDKGSDKSGPWS